jgi:hypothetical protein
VSRLPAAELDRGVLVARRARAVKAEHARPERELVAPVVPAGWAGLAPAACSWCRHGSDPARRRVRSLGHRSRPLDRRNAETGRIVDGYVCVEGEVPPPSAGLVERPSRFGQKPPERASERLASPIPEFKYLAPKRCPVRFCSFGRIRSKSRKGNLLCPLCVLWRHVSV